MAKKSAYEIIKHRHVTEKARVLQELHSAESSASLRRCDAPKYVFIVDKSAEKPAIAAAVEEIYKQENIKVVAVNTINVKAKKCRVRGRVGSKNAFKKAVVTLRPGDYLDKI